MATNAAHAEIPLGARAALEAAFDAWRANGLPCGAAIVDSDGQVIARGRNHAYDPLTGTDPLEGTPLAHAELNTLARIPTSHDLSTNTLWSTQQPCSMCAAAISFCGVGSVRFLAFDPAFVATDDHRSGDAVDPTIEHPELVEWAILANALFLQPSISRNDEERLERNRHVEPETAVAASTIASGSQTDSLDSLIGATWNQLQDLADRRRRRMSTQPRP